MATKKKADKPATGEQISVWFSNEQLAALRRIQEADLAPLGAQIRKAVDAYLETKKDMEK